MFNLSHLQSLKIWPFLLAHLCSAGWLKAWADCQWRTEGVGMKVIGLISGTSSDGIDAALSELSGRGFESEMKLLAFATFPYPESVRRRLLGLASGHSDLQELSHMNFLLGELFARAASDIAKKGGVPLGEVELIGSHGQTLVHCPRPISEFGKKIRSTLQIAEPSVIAERTGITTVADFRPRDMAAGEEGAPLTPTWTSQDPS